MSLTDLSTAQAVGLGALITVQIVLMIIALRVWMRKTQHPSALAGAAKWGSLIVIILGQIIGPIVFLAVIAPQYADPTSRNENERHLPKQPKRDDVSVHDIWETR